ncbi:S41 family peptidase [Saccharophagus degradans]|uniref:S41 family peptidase n=1 Tax=Saccharophagus degradans TaxID=86304 RepID=UPI001C08426F|nr:S41 family peptidase [Saccharophagus degradans]
MPHLYSFLRKLSVFSLAACAPLFVQAQTPSNEPEDADTISVLPLEDLRVFTKAYEHIRSSYIEEIDDRTLLEYAIRGMLDELDPHSAFLDASSFDDLQVHTSGEFGGLGIEVGIEDGFVKVISPIDDTPAQKAGVEAGDLIIKINGTSVKGITLSDAVEKMRGAPGTDITLTIMRKDVEQPFDLVLTRDKIKVRSVRSDIVEHDFAYLRVAQFQLRTGQDLANEIKKLQKINSDLKGVILDLRNNPGGVLTASVEVADLFLNDGLIVYTEGRMHDANSQYSATPGDAVDGLPMVVLINGGSASASEIVAGALQDQNRALVLGTRSFGKGSVQTVISITEDRAIKITTALYFTPNGRSIQAQGIEPDIEVERVKITAVQPQADITEADLSGHLKNAKGGAEVKASDRGKRKNELHERDSQLYEAVNILRGLHLFQKAQQAKAEKELEKSQAAEQAAAETTETP